MASTSLTPMLTVKDAETAVGFYERAFGAVERSRLSTPAGQLVIELAIDDHCFYVVDENRAAFNLSPVDVLPQR